MKLKTLRNFARMSRALILELSKKILSSMARNASIFTTPRPSDEEYQAKIAECEELNRQVETAEENLNQARESRNNGFQELVNLTTRRADYVDYTAEGNWDILNASGFDICDPSPHSEIPCVIQNFQVIATQIPGVVNYKWDIDANAKTYQISVTDDLVNKSAWKVLGLSTKSSFTAEGLESGKRLLFKVCGFNANGTGPDSNSVEKVVP